MSFSAILGQEKAIQLLKEHLRNLRLANAYLFTGPEGIGKGLTAKTFAKALNCQEAYLDSCDRCVSCQKIEKDTHPDIHILDFQDSEIKIDAIRQLQREIALRAYEARYKVFIIKNAHNLNIASSNSLLKTLEEAQDRTLLILITEKPNLLLSTITSRCRPLRFYPFSRLKLEGLLLREYCLPEGLAHFLAYFCEGRLGYALRLKDADILQEKNRVIDEFSFSKNQGLTGQFRHRERADMRLCLNILASWLRDIYLLKTGLAYSEVINLDRKQELSKLQNSFSFLDLDEALGFVSCAFWYLEHNVNVRLIEANLREVMYAAR